MIALLPLINPITDAPDSFGGISITPSGLCYAVTVKAVQVSLVILSSVDPNNLTSDLLERVTKRDFNGFRTKSLQGN